MIKDTEKTRVLFVYPQYSGGAREVLALFPDEHERIYMGIGRAYKDGVMSYAHIGQHSAACKTFLRRKRATVEQFEPLYNELESMGYNLDVINPFYTYEDLKAEYRLMQDSGDKWGSAMECFFSLCAELWMRGAYDAPEWGYSPGIADDPREPDGGYYEIFIDAQTDALQKLGALMFRYTGILEAAGHSY